MTHNEPPPPWLFAVFPVMWVAIGFLISRMGWSDFAQKYLVKKLPKGEKFGSLSGHSFFLGFYNNVLMASIAPEGFGLSVFFLFRAFHPHLLIPWSNVTVTKNHSYLWKELTVTLKGPNRTLTVFLPLRAKESIEKYCPVLEL